MNPFWQSIIIQIVTDLKTKENQKPFSRYRIAKMYREWRITWKSRFKSVILITIGIFLAAFGFKGFLLTNDFIDGGSTGISLLLSATTKLPLQYFLVIVNIPFIVLAYKVMGRTFAVKTALAIIGLIMCLTLVKFPNVTNDNLLVAVFGGFFLGAGIGFAIRGGAVIDGSEVLAIFLSRKFGMTIGDVIAVINVMIFLAAAYFLSVEKALYSMITYLAASKTLDFIVEGIEEYIGVTIVAVHSEEMRQMIIKKLGRGVTVYKGKRGYGDIEFAKDVNVIYTVITRLEIAKLNTEIEKIEPDAFVVMHSVKDTRGGMIKRRPLDH
jgi:uncharacterized membrane-anchored protein YitT (DUF2179 family)